MLGRSEATWECLDTSRRRNSNCGSRSYSLGVMMGEDHPPISPFLFIPQSWMDNGSRPQSGTGWVSCPSIFLLDTKTPKIVMTPEIGNSYRVVVIIGNSGSVPVENGFARFLFSWMPPIGQTSGLYEKSPIDPNTPPPPAYYYWDLGTSAFSIGSSIGGQDLGWAVSPETWVTSKDYSWQGSTIAACESLIT